MEIAVVIVSDRSSRGERDDITGPELIDYLKSDGISQVIYRLVPDDKEAIKKNLNELIAMKINLILTSGGTGFAKRDLTPEATREVIEKEAPGIAEFIRIENYKNSKNSFLSRGVCGIKNETIILNLPGSPKGALESYKIVEKLIPHCVSLINGSISDCLASLPEK
ncbi:MAG TPA: MogA/MoaB family molybdenum cofactor biosynthesis protein [Spirochaetota bacterium]|nr:MogA/MoaB family molybdenum cofactor biosynthesis protein [Spirochaetota bacterium]